VFSLEVQPELFGAQPSMAIDCCDRIQLSGAIIQNEPQEDSIQTRVDALIALFRAFRFDTTLSWAGAISALGANA
jgi:hypothetical protein